MTAPSTRAILAPETATRWEIPARRMISSASSPMPAVSPLVIPRTRAASSSGRWAVASRACMRRACRRSSAMPAAPSLCRAVAPLALSTSSPPPSRRVPRTWTRSPGRAWESPSAPSPWARSSSGSDAGRCASSLPSRACPRTVRAIVWSPERDHGGPRSGVAGAPAVTTTISTVRASAAASSSTSVAAVWRCSAGNSSAPARAMTPRWANTAWAVRVPPRSITAARASETITAAPAIPAAAPTVMPSTASAHTTVAAGSSCRSERRITGLPERRARSWRRSRSRAHRELVPGLREGRRAVARDLWRIIGGTEGAVLLPVVGDALSDGRADTGQLLELPRPGDVEIDRSVAVGAAGGSVGGELSPVRVPEGHRRALPGLGHMDLFPVDEAAGEIHGSQVRFGGDTARTLDSVIHPGTGRQLHQAGTFDGPGDVHHHRPGIAAAGVIAAGGSGPVLALRGGRPARHSGHLLLGLRPWLCGGGLVELHGGRGCCRSLVEGDG